MITRRFGSIFGCHHSYMFLGCLMAMLLVIGTRAQSKAEEDRVAITIYGSDLKEESEKQDFEELRNLILDSFDDALWPDFNVLEDINNAKFDIDVKIRGPFNKCNWNIRCRWYSRNSINLDKRGRPILNKCWHPVAHVRYCDEASSDDISQINCLGDILDFTAPQPPRPEKDLCDTSNIRNASKKKIVYTSCFTIQLEEAWREKIKKTADKIPLQIASELSEEFRSLGYEIVPEICVESTTKPQDIYAEIVGMIEELPKEDKIYVSLFVVGGSAHGENDIKKIIYGSTPMIDREDHRNLGESIINHIRIRFKKP